MTIFQWLYMGFGISIQGFLTQLTEIDLVSPSLKSLICFAFRVKTGMQCNYCWPLVPVLEPCLSYAQSWYSQGINNDINIRTIIFLQQKVRFLLTKAIFDGMVDTQRSYQLATNCSGRQILRHQVQQNIWMKSSRSTLYQGSIISLTV